VRCVVNGASIKIQEVNFIEYKVTYYDESQICSRGKILSQERIVVLIEICETKAYPTK